MDIENMQEYMDLNPIGYVPVMFNSDVDLEDSFVEKGMKAYLTGITYPPAYSDEFSDCYKVYFVQDDFIDHNRKMLPDVYFSNIHTNELPYKKALYTAEEAGMFPNEWCEFIYVVNLAEDTITKVMDKIIVFLKEDY